MNKLKGKLESFIDRYFDLICLSFGLISIVIGILYLEYLKDSLFVILLGIGGMLTTISAVNFLNPYCRDKLRGISTSRGNSN